MTGADHAYIVGMHDQKTRVSPISESLHKRRGPHLCLRQVPGHVILEPHIKARHQIASRTGATYIALAKIVSSATVSSVLSVPNREIFSRKVA